jgi:hypothetical protein
MAASSTSTTRRSAIPDGNLTVLLQQDSKTDRNQYGGEHRP